VKNVTVYRKETDELIALVLEEDGELKVIASEDCEVVVDGEVIQDIISGYNCFKW